MQVDLSVNAGLRLSLDGNELRFGRDVEPVTQEVRLAGDMKELFYAPATADPKQQLYAMYRNVVRGEDKEKFNRWGLRHDITVIPPGLVGPEYVKTAGHYHPAPGATKKSFPEVYGVIHGQAHYLLQYLDPETGYVEEVVLFEAGPGDKVVIPPNWGHVTINPGNEVLVMANLVADGFSPLYEPMANLKGAAYYEVRVQGESTFVGNPNYDYVPQLQRRFARQYQHLGLVKGVSLYEAFLGNPELFRYLTDPEVYPD
ncbi:MAG: glucose-6-phosphate isomerase [Firmicutes bacterium]|jgi:glucose-6-phosphate isomerase|nr:glucose-6-phosphate isomerase [Bacillota bacterium]